jgi:hypothetical protein
MTEKISLSALWSQYNNIILEGLVLLSLMGLIYYVYRSDDIRWHDIHTKSHDDRLWHSSNINNSRGYSIGITDQRDLYQLHWDGLNAKYTHTIKVRGFRQRNAITVVLNIHSFICYMFLSYDHLQVEIYLSENYTTDNESVVVRILVTVKNSHGDRFHW